MLELLYDSTRLQIRSDVPLGGYLSGGIDSSLVCRLAAERLEQPMPMFHGRFAEGPEYDESPYAKALVDHAGGLYFDVVPTAVELVSDLPKLIEALDEPLAGPGLFPQYAVCKLAKQHVTVVLGGQGGDEIFGGYARYLVGYLEQALKGAILETQEEGKHLVTLESIVPNLALLKQYTPLLGNFWSKGSSKRWMLVISTLSIVARGLTPCCIQTLWPNSIEKDCLPTSKQSSTIQTLAHTSIR